MPRTPEEQALIARFSKRYQLGQSAVMQTIERAVCGCDYGGTSWTTRQEACAIKNMLNLGPGRRLLEVGAGSGWPGLYLAAETGCDIALIDLPFEGVRIAKERAVSDRLPGACWAAVADGSALPFPNGSFDAIAHSDLLCCVARKSAVLAACREVVRPGGRMVFSVILIGPALSGTDYQRAVAGGPPFVETAIPYPDLLERTGWHLTDCADLTAAYLDCVHRLLGEEEAHAEELADLYGQDEFSEVLGRRRATVDALEHGLLRRQLFRAVPALEDRRTSGSGTGATRSSGHGCQSSAGRGGA